MKNTTMRAVGIIPRQRHVAEVRHEHPEIVSPTQIKVRTLDVGICGTDREICTFVYGEPPANSDYLILGHEALGIVVDVAAEVTQIKIGDLVVPSVRRPCADPHCRPCRMDRQDFCATWKFNERGIHQHHGFMTEFFVDDEKNFIFVPPELRYRAVLAEPLTIAEKGLSQVWSIQSRLPWACDQPGKPKGDGLRAVVIGAGPIGILGAMACVLNGFDTYVYSRSPKPNEKSEIVESFGATYVSTAESSPAELADRVGSIDLVYEAVGVSKTSFEVMMHLGINGIFVFTGIPAPEGNFSLAGNQLMRNIVLKNQVIVGTVNADKASFCNAIRDLGEFHRRWPQALERIISARYPIEKFQELLTGKMTGIKNVIAFSE